MPDDVLNAAADAKQLQTKEQILAQAQRMIQVREKTGAVSAFHEKWAQMNNGSAHWFQVGASRPRKYPAFTRLWPPSTSRS